MTDDTGNGGSSMDQTGQDDQTGHGDGNGAGGGERMLPQSQVDRIVQDRLARQKAQFADYDALKEKAARFDELEKAQMSELERANARIAELERQNAEAALTVQDSRLRAAVTAEAAKRNVVDPDAALALLDRGAIEFDTEGVPTNIAQAMDSLLEQRPFLVAARGGTRGSADLGAREGGGPKQLTRDDLKTMTPKQIVEARKAGQLDALSRGDA